MSNSPRPAQAGPVLLETKQDGIATLVMNRPDRLNALNNELATALNEALARIAADDSIRVVVLTGAGRAFCAGGDLALIGQGRASGQTQLLEPLLRSGMQAVLKMRVMPQPVIAAVNGAAAGAGMNVALAADIRIAAEEASFGQNFAKVGLFPDFGGTYFLPQLVGPAKAAELFYTGDMIDAKTALYLGIVNRVVPVAQLEAEVKSLAQKIMQGPPVARFALLRKLCSAAKRISSLRLSSTKYRSKFAAICLKIAAKAFAPSSKNGLRSFAANSRCRIISRGAKENGIPSKARNLLFPANAKQFLRASPHMTAHPETIQLRIERRAAWITLDRPPLNILDISMMESLDAALGRALPKSDFIVFQGAGVKAFCAGANVADHTPELVGKMLHAFHAVFRRLAAADCLTIAAVHGYCLGGGMELATFCDFVLATESALFGQPEIKLGCFPPVALVTLPRLIGLQAAAHLILAGHEISSPEAQRLGLVTRVVQDYELPATVDALLEELRALSPSVLHLTRKTLRQLHSADFLQQLEEAERVYLSELMQTHDAREGIRAFLEKRKPVWKAK